MSVSTNLRTACAHMVNTGALDELADMLERNSFDIWKASDECDDYANRKILEGHEGVIMWIRNIAAEK